MMPLEIKFFEEAFVFDVTSIPFLSDEHKRTTKKLGMRKLEKREKQKKSGGYERQKEERELTEEKGLSNVGVRRKRSDI